MILHPDVVPYFLVSGLYLIIFATAEILRAFGRCEVETTRKFVQFWGRALSLSFSYVFVSPWTILALLISFVSILALGKKLRFLQSLHKEERTPASLLYYPLAVFLSFTIAGILEKPHFYLISMMVLSVSDALASIIGDSYGFKVYSVEEDQKSFEGSLFFLLSTFLIVHLGLLLLSPIDRPESVLCAVYIAILVTCFEAISLGGFQDLFIPIGTTYILTKITKQSAGAIGYQIELMLAVFALTFLISLPKKKLGLTGLIGVWLIGYGAWSLLGFEWYIPILLATVGFSFFDLFIPKPAKEEKRHMIRAVFYLVGSSLFWILTANLALVTWGLHSPRIFFIPYLVGMLGHFSIIWGYRARNHLGFETVALPNWVSQAPLLLRSVLLTLCFLPIQLLVDPKLLPLHSAVTTVAGIALSDILFQMIAFRGLKWDGITWSLGARRARLLVVLFVSGLLFWLNYQVYPLPH